MTTAAAKTRERARGKLKIGDDWNAITIIALSQSNPLKAIAELLENSIDAKASSVTITRGRERGHHFWRYETMVKVFRAMQMAVPISTTLQLIRLVRYSSSVCANNAGFFGRSIRSNIFEWK